MVVYRLIRAPKPRCDIEDRLANFTLGLSDAGRVADPAALSIVSERTRQLAACHDAFDCVSGVAELLGSARSSSAQLGGSTVLA